MPTSFLAYAVDFDEDGQTDIWTTEADVFGSIANYLAERGWKGDEPWGREVTLPADFEATRATLAENSEGGCRALRRHSERTDTANWQDRGLKTATGGDLPVEAATASLLQPDGPDGPAYLTYGNFRAILGYNCTNLYALAVGHLADKIK